MIEGFVHLRKRLPRDVVKKIIGMINMRCQYMGYSKSILFFLDEKYIDEDIKEYLLKKFVFIKKYVDKIIVFTNDKTDKSKTLIFNYTND